MRRLALATLFLLVCPIALAHQHAVAAPGALSPCTKFKDFAGAVDQPEFRMVPWVVTGSTEAQKYFNQGMTQYWGFNYEEAMRNFKKAKELDTSMAMAPWGIALAAGPNINIVMDKDCHGLANDEIKEAVRRSSGQTGLHTELIKALQKRYQYTDGDTVGAAKAYADYSEAMADVWRRYQNLFPNYPEALSNVGALYAESMIDLHAWALFGNNGCPNKDVPLQIFDVLSRSIVEMPSTIGANHYWIHAVEASFMPSAALSSANLLQWGVEEQGHRKPMPAGHLMHMSSHIYLRMGDYQKSLDSNRKAVDDDVDQYGAACSGPYLTYAFENKKCPQLYYGHYLSHNYSFGSVSATFMGRSEEAMKLACATRAHVERFVIYEPGLQRYMTAPLMTMVVNRNWDAILKETASPDPPKFEDCYWQEPFNKDSASGCYILRSIWYWARGMALATPEHSADAQKALEKMQEAKNATRDHPPETWGNNFAESLLTIASDILNARIAWANSPDKTTYVLVPLDDAVTWEDALIYDEPPQWFTPAREALGGAYLQLGQYDKATETFRAELARHPASGRALYGLMRALQGLAAELASKDKQKADDATREAGSVKDQFCLAWRDADYTMTDDDLWPDRKGSTKKAAVTCEREKQILKPSVCACPATKWPPIGVADQRANELKCAN